MRVATFITGFLTGVYITQTYNTPRVDITVKDLYKKLTEYEKVNKKSENKK